MGYFGGELALGVAGLDTSNVGTVGAKPALVAGPGQVFTFYDNRGGTQVTDLKLFDTATSSYSIATTTITSIGTTSVGAVLPHFEAPGHDYLWVQASIDGSGGTYWVLLRSWNSSGVPSGGTGGQALLKQSDTDGDAEWGDLPDGLSASSYVTNNVLNKTSKANLQTELGVDDATLQTRVLAILSGNSFYPNPYLGDGDPLPVSATEGAVVDVITGTVSTGFTVTSIIAESVTPSTTSQPSTTPSALGANTVCYAAVATYQSGATAGAPAARPTGMTGMGLTWTEVAIPVTQTTNGLNSLKIFKGVGTGTATKPVAAFTAAPTGVHMRVVQVANATGTVRQATSAQITGGTAAATASLPSAVSGTGYVLSWIVQNNNTNPQTPGTGYTEIGTAASSTGMRTSGESAIPGTQSPSWTKTVTPTGYQALVAAIEGS